MRKIFILVLAITAFGYCKQKYDPNSAGIQKSEINQKIAEVMAKAEKAADENEKAHFWGDASELLCEKGDFKKALQVARDAKRLNPTDKKALASIAEIYLYERKIGEAEIVLQEVLGRDSNYGRANYLMGNLQLFKKNLPGAEKHFRKVLDTNPESINAYLNLAVTLDRKGNSGDAIKTLEQAIEKGPSIAETYKSAGILSEKSGNKADAKKYYEKYLELNPYGDDVEAVKLWLKNLT